MITIPNQSSVPKAWTEFDEKGRMKPSGYRDRVVDVCEEMFKFTGESPFPPCLPSFPPSLKGTGGYRDQVVDMYEGTIKESTAYL